MSGVVFAVPVIVEDAKVKRVVGTAILEDATYDIVACKIFDGRALSDEDKAELTNG